MGASCSVSELVYMGDKQVRLCCNSSAAHRIQEDVPNYGPSIHYLCGRHRRDLLPMCKPSSNLTVVRLGGS